MACRDIHWNPLRYQNERKVRNEGTKWPRCVCVCVYVCLFVCLTSVISVISVTVVRVCGMKLFMIVINNGTDDGLFVVSPTITGID